jgi:hypothetical protein
MTEYLLNIIIGEQQVAPIPMSSPDFNATLRDALRTACLSINENSDAFWRTGEWQMIVTDATGLMLFTLEMHATMAPVATGHIGRKVGYS